jgi:hypothetical protein
MKVMPLKLWSRGEQPDGGFKLKTSRSRRQGFLLYWGGIATLFAILVGSTPWINAQIATTTATLSGVVTDSTGALVPKATVTLTSQEKGVTRTFTTDDGGRYSFNQLPPAGYSLVIKAKGFKTYQQNGIALNAAETATQNVTLTIGSESTSITVTSDVALLNTDNSNVAADIGAKQIVELPLNVRNVYGLATLNSSIQNTSEGQLLLGGGSNTTDTADQDISFMNFAGGFFGTTAFLVDGSWDTDSQWGAVIFVPGVDAVQEFKVQNNSFTAQYGWSTGNVVNVVTKSGTNTFHGSGYEFWSSDKFNAFNYFQSPGSCNSTGINACTFSRNQAGVTAGGPLYIPGLYKQRNKTFVYGIYDHFSSNTPSPSQYTVPDTKFLAGDFSEQLGAQGKDSHGNLLFDALGRAINVGAIYDPRSGHAITANVPDTKTAANPYGTGLVPTQTGFIRNPIPGNILSNIAGYTPDAVGSKLLSYYPAAQLPGNVSNNLTLAGKAPTYWDEYGIRVDHNINDNTSAYFRYSYKQEQKTGVAATWGDNPASQANVRPNNRWGMWAGLTRIFNPTFTMNITSGVQIWHETSSNASMGFDSTTIGLPAYVTQNYPLFPIVNVGQGISQLGPFAGNQQATTNHGPIGTVAVDFIKTHGKNTVNFGFMGVEQIFSQNQINNTELSFEGNFTTGPNPLQGAGINTGNGVAQMLLGVMDTSTTDPTSIETRTTPYESNHLFGEYLQDDWKPTSKLTLNVGIRYEIQTPYTSRRNQGSIFDPTALNPLSSMAGEPLNGALKFLGPGNRNFYNTNHDNIAPRIGFSYQALRKAVIHGGYGIFYPEAVTSGGSDDLDGFAATTSLNQSLDGGVTPNPTISTKSPWGGQYAQITGNVNGSFQQDGNGVGGVFRSRPSPYVQQWLLGVQYAFTPNDQLDINYIGNRGVRMESASWNYNQLNPKYLFNANGTPNTTLTNAAAFNPLAASLQALEKGGTIAPSSCNIDSATNLENYQLLLAYPQYCGVSQTDAPVGQSLYNSLQITYNHRVSKGLTALVSYTYSKFLDNVEGNNSWSYNGAANWGATANYFNIAGEKSVDAGDIPQALVASYVYKLPIGRGNSIGSGMSRIADAVVGGWEISGIATFKDGLPISVFGSGWNSFGGDPRPDEIGNPKPAHQTISTAAGSWVNPAAFAYAPYGDFGTAPRYLSNLRGPHYQNWDTALEKNWQIKQSMRAQFRFETFNSFNHPNFYTPGPGNTNLGNPGAFGAITTAFQPRVVQFAGKFYW